MVESANNNDWLLRLFLLQSRKDFKSMLTSKGRVSNEHRVKHTTQAVPVAAVIYWTVLQPALDSYTGRARRHPTVS